MLVKTVSFNDFLEEFEKFGREDNFSYEGKKALFDYLNQLSDDIGEPIELDIIGICCDFTEYSCLEEFNDAYGYTVDEINSIDDISYYTTVIPIDDEGFIIQDF
jgi:hypothetical protein